MATLPTAEQLGTTNPTPGIQQNTFTPDPVAAATKGFGDKLEQAGLSTLDTGLNQLTKETTATDALNKARADAAVTIKASQLKAGADQEENDDALKGYGDQLNQTIDQQASLFRDRQQFALFKAQHQSTAADTQIAANAELQSRQTDAAQAETEDQYASSQKDYANAKTDADRQKIRSVMDAQLDAQGEAGVYSDVEVGRLKRAWASGAAFSSIKAMTPQQQVAALSPVQVGAQQSKAMQYFTSKGWSKEAAAGIVGGLSHESIGLQPGIVNPGDGSDGSDSIGIGQWNSDRAVALKQFAASQGKSWQDFNTQLAFVDHELRTSESTAGDALNNAKSVNDAAAAAVLYERPKGYENGPTGAAGWNNRLRQAQAVYTVGTGGKLTPAPGAPLASMISPDQKLSLIDGAERQIDQGNRAEAASVKGLIADDQSSIMNTGQPVAVLTPERVARSYGPAAAQSFIQDRVAFQKYYAATNDWTTIPSDQIGVRLGTLAPQPGQPDFVSQQNIYNSAQQKATAIIQQRATDPAGAVAAFPQVKAAAQSANPQVPGSYAPLVKARMEAQTSIGIPDRLQSPIPDTEAKAYATQLRAVSAGQANVQEQTRVIQGVAQEVSDRYGDFAQRAMGQILYHVTMKRDAADVLAAAMERLKSNQPGPLVTTDDAAKIQMERDRDRAAQIANVPSPNDYDPRQAADGVQPLPPVPADYAGKKQLKPFYSAVDKLRSDPDNLIAPFVQKYGADAVPSDLVGKLPPAIAAQRSQNAVRQIPLTQ